MAGITLSNIKSLLTYIKQEVFALVQSMIMQKTATVTAVNTLKLHTEQTSSTLTIGNFYEIVNNSGGAIFTSVGAADNNVGTQFKATATTPTWGTGTLASAETAWNGSSVNITGTGTINTISKKFFNYGYKLHFIADGAFTLAHNQAGSGDDVGIMLKDGSNKTLAVGDEVFLQLRNDNKWYETGAASLPNPMLFKGAITINTDFPLLANVKTGWFYKINASVTDNAGVTYTNTGLSFLAGDEICWDGSTWINVGNTELWSRSGTILSPVTSNDSVNLGSGTISATTHTTNSGSMTLTAASGQINVGKDMSPVSNNGYNLGDSSYKWASIHTVIENVYGRQLLAQGANIASANDLTLGSDGNTFIITGTTTINRILNTNWQAGSVVRLQTQSALTIANGVASGSSYQSIITHTASNYTTSANEIITLIYATDTNWYITNVSKAVSTGGLTGVNIETISNNRTLVYGTDKSIQVLTVPTNGYAITLSNTNAVEGATFLILNKYDGTWNTSRVTVNDNSANVLCTIPNYGYGLFVYTGSTWILLELGTGRYDANSVSIGDGASAIGGISIGNGAISGDKQIRIGYMARGVNVTIGYNAQGSGGDYGGIGIGRDVVAYADSIAIGQNATNNGKSRAIALGKDKVNQRGGEFRLGYESHAIYSNVTYKKVLLTDTFETLDINDVYLGTYFQIIANTTVHFIARIVAGATTINLTKAYKAWTLEGLISRDGSNNTTIIGSVTKTVIAETGVSGSINTANWDVQAIADDINEYLLVQGKTDAPIISSDTANQLSGLKLTMIPQDIDTGYYRLVYWKLTDVAGTRTFALYTSSAFTTLIATGSRVGDGVIVLAGGLGRWSGQVTIAYTADDIDTSNTIEIFPINMSVNVQTIESYGTL